MSQGWIRVWRQVFDNPELDDKPYNSGFAWVYLLSRVQHKKTVVRFGGTIHPLERGQLVTSVRHLAKQCGWSKTRVSTWLRHLTIAEMVTLGGTPKGTLITVLNWDEYQPLGGYSQSGKDTNRDTKRDTTGTLEGHYKDTSNNTEGNNTEEHKGGGHFSASPKSPRRSHRRSAKRTAANALKYLNERKEKEKGGDSNAKD